MPDFAWDQELPHQEPRSQKMNKDLIERRLLRGYELSMLSLVLLIIGFVCGAVVAAAQSFFLIPAFILAFTRVVLILLAAILALAIPVVLLLYAVGYIAEKIMEV